MADAAASESDGYRGATGQHSLVLRAGEGERLRVVAESAGAEEDRVLAPRYRLLDLWFAVVAVVAVVTVLGYAWGIHESQTAMGTISGLNTCTSSKGTSHYLCFDATYPVTLAAGVSVSRICSALQWDPDVAPPEGPPGSDRVRIAFLPGVHARCNVGARLTGSLWEIVLLTLIPGATGVAALVAWGRPGASGLWYDREPLNTEELQ